VRDRIDRKIMAQLRPKDLFYQILDGLRSLIRYDHSSALLIRDADDGALVLAAEQIAWTKGKSRRIGKRFPLDEDAHRALASETVFGFDRVDDAWREWDDRAPGGATALALARLLDYNRPGGRAMHDDLREGAMIVAPLATGDGLFGVLKVAARHPGAFSTWDAELVERFRSQAAVAIQNSQRAESLQARMLQAEKKHAMADLARSVAHDVNNALGSVMPLVQQLERDASEGALDAAVLREDLAQIQKGLSVCRRIFGGMLGFARGRAARTSHGQIRLAVEGMIAILKDGLDRRAITLVVDVPDRLPPIAGGQNDLEQVLLNLCTNARDAMPNGGRLTVLARQRGTQIELVVSDTGAGIPEENLAMVQEPFFTTKPEGSGLGLAIVRSIVWEMGGKMTIESRPNEGTRIRLQLPEAPNA
jgi:two-component system, NtrC family, sensor kinase